ncbi:hypothetical protein GTW37_13305 [Streptomyces sp. SID4931]|nr:hypothetical protein [Streptomyces sp. SID4931]SCF83681.1 hypothetical protein GA0115255_108213 [Streptomyces sp. Ncost-T6T-2b]
MSDTGTAAETDTGIDTCTGTAAVRPRIRTRSGPVPLHVQPSAPPSVTAPTGGPLDV